MYKDSSAGRPWPMLTKMNYHEWSSLMKVKMQGRQLWDAIEFADLPYHDDRRALEAIIVGVPLEMGAPLSDKASPRRHGTPSPLHASASTASAAPRCSDYARSGRTSPSISGSRSRTSPFAYLR
jgi:hypothetical protein